MSKPFNYGGQAVIEGVMMRGSQSVAVCVRNPDGAIEVMEEELNPAVYRGFVARTPFLRGMTLLWDALGLGMKALTFSANVALGEEEDLEGPALWITMAVSLALSISLFFLAPAAVADLLVKPEVSPIPAETESLDAPAPTGAVSPENASVDKGAVLASNLTEGVVRLLLVIGYIWAIGKMSDVDRLFRYHGAEHKTINAYEAGADLTPESVDRFPLEHPRCGTAFLLTVVVVSVLVFSVMGRPDILGIPPIVTRLVSRVLLLPVIAGIGYEYIRFTAKHLDNSIVRVIVKPNLWLQKLTTRPPDATMLEVAIKALELVLASEGVMEAESAPEAPAGEVVSAAAGN